MFREVNSINLRKYLGVVLAAMMIVLASCVSAEPAASPEVSEPEASEPETSESVTEITVPSWWADHEIAGAEAAFDNIFTEETGIVVNYDRITSNYDEKVFTSLVSDDPYDVITFNADDVPRYLARDVLMPIDTFVAQDNYDLSNFLPVVTEQWTHEGELYGLSNDMGSFHCYFNYDLFEEAGLVPPEPTEEWTWDQLLEWARALTVKEGNRTLQYGFASGMNWAVEVWPYLNGVSIFDEDLSESLLDDPRVIEAFDFYQDLMYEERVALQPGAIETGPNNLFLAGQVGILCDGTWQVGYFRSQREEIDFEWNVGLLPHNVSAEEWYVPTFTAGWVIPKSAENPEASWEALKFYASDTFAEEVMFVSLSGLPTTKSALEGAWYDQWPENPPEGLTRDFYGKMIDHSKSRPTIGYDLGSSLDASMSKLDLIYNNEEEPSDLLPRLAQEVNEGLAERPWNQ